MLPLLLLLSIYCWDAAVAAAAGADAIVVVGAAVAIYVFYLWDRISALTYAYASTWPVYVPKCATSILAESVPTPE